MPPVMFKIKEKASPEANPNPKSINTKAVMPTNMAAVSTVCVKKSRCSLFLPVQMRTKLYLMMTKFTGMYRIRCVTTMTLKKSKACCGKLSRIIPEVSSPKDRYPTSPMTLHMTVPVRTALPVIPLQASRLRLVFSVEMYAWKFAEAQESEKMMEPVDCSMPVKLKTS